MYDLALQGTFLRITLFSESAQVVPGGTSDSELNLEKLLHASINVHPPAVRLPVVSVMRTDNSDCLLFETNLCANIQRRSIFTS